MPISIVQVVKDSSKFSIVNILSSLIGIPITIFVATILVPEEYGIYGFLSLWLLYAGLIGPGIYAAGYREIPVLLGKDKKDEALRIQNSSITSEMLYSLLPFTVILVSSLFFSNNIIRIGLVIVAVSYISNQTVKYWSGINFLKQKFNLVAKGNLLAVIVSPLVILVGVYWLKVYALLIAPVLVALVSGIYYYKKGPIDFHFIFSRRETKRLLKIGIVLQAGTLAYWGFRLADRTIIASLLSLEELGLYTFSISFVMVGVVFFSNFGNVLEPIIWKETGKTNNPFDGFRETRRIAIYIALVSAITVTISQLGFFSVVSLVATKYVGSISIFFVLSYNLFLIPVTIVPAIILTSSVVNKQKLFLGLYLAGLVLNVIFDIVVISYGYGVVGIAWITICTQGMVTFVLYSLIRDMVFPTDFLKSLCLIVFPFLCSIMFYFFHNYLYSVGVWEFIGLSLAIQGIVWGGIIYMFYRDYFSFNILKTMLSRL